MPSESKKPRFRTLSQRRRDGEVELRGRPVSAAVNPALPPREAFKLKHGVYPYDGELPPWEVEDDGT